MKSRERILMALHHEEPDRVPIYDSPWVSTLDRWLEEGLPEDTSPAEHFGYELIRFGSDTSPRFPIEIRAQIFRSHKSVYGSFVKTANPRLV